MIREGFVLTFFERNFIIEFATPLIDGKIASNGNPNVAINPRVKWGSLQLNKSYTRM